MSETLREIPEELAPTGQICILPDGRVHVHGMTREILEVLEQLEVRDTASGELAARTEREKP